jgi:hypothetical protein
MQVFQWIIYFWHAYKYRILYFASKCCWVLLLTTLIEMGMQEKFIYELIYSILRIISKERVIQKHY